jgi:hypothetical protein
MSMATKKEALPEISVDVGPIVTEAKQASDARSKAAEYTTIEKKHAENMSKIAEGLRQEQVTRENYIGIIRVTGPDLPPVRVEFRMENGPLDVSEEKHLDELYGTLRPLLFGREKIVKEITNPAALIQELIDSGKNPWDYLELSVMEGMDHVLSDSEHVITQEAFLPREGFLNKLNETRNTQSYEAKQFNDSYLQGALKPRVVLGTAKGK